jgi:hypothetical protein
VPGAELAPVIPLRSPVVGEGELERLRRAVDLPRLIAAGYDPGARVIRPPREHPVFGYELCLVPRCTAAVESGGLCHACRARFTGCRGTVEEFVAIPRVFGQSGRAEQRLCLVCCTPGHERAADRRNGLCFACELARRRRGQTVEEYVAGALPARRSGAALAASAGPPTRLVCAAPVRGSGSRLAGQTSRSSPQRRCRRAGWRVAASRSICPRSPSDRALRSSTGSRRSGWMAAMPGMAPAGCRAWSTRWCAPAPGRCWMSR